MISLTKKLLYILIFLIPLTVISFFFKGTNFIIQDNKQSVEDNNFLVKVSSEEEPLNLEDYVIGVVAGEMPALYELDALKAQAIASRTYVFNYINADKTISNNTDRQVYLTEEEMKAKWQDNYLKYYNKIKEAVLATEDLIMYHNNKPIKAYYYAMSNGYTESSLNVFNEQNDYLEVIESPFDQDNSHTLTISKEKFCQSLDITCSNVKISNILKDESNRVASITINNHVFTGIEVRKKLSLRSTDFVITPQEENIIIETKGYGHGVGMSQTGANNMAKLGYSYEEILKYYYQNIEIATI